MFGRSTASELPATANVRSSFKKKALLADCALLPRTAGRPENRAGNPDLTSRFALVRYAG